MRNKKTNKLLNIFCIIEDFALLMHKDFVNIRAIELPKDVNSSKTLLEIFFFLMWELDVCLYGNSQSEDIRRKCISYIRDAVAVTSRFTDKEKLTNILHKRLGEYGEIERSNNKIGSPTCLVTNFLIHNLHYVQDKDDFFYCDSTRPIYLTGVFKQIEYGQYILAYHARIRGFFYNLFKNCTDFMILKDNDFEKRLQEASTKDKVIQKSLNESLKNLQMIT